MNREPSTWGHPDLGPGSSWGIQAQGARQVIQAAAPGPGQTWWRRKSQDFPRTTLPGTRTRYLRLQSQGAGHHPRQIKIDKAACPVKLRRRRCHQPQNTAYSTQSVTDVWRQCLLLYILIPPKRPFYPCKGEHQGCLNPLCFQPASCVSPRVVRSSICSKGCALVSASSISSYSASIKAAGCSSRSLPS